MLLRKMNLSTRKQIILLLFFSPCSMLFGQVFNQTASQQTPSGWDEESDTLTILMRQLQDLEVSVARVQ